MKGNKNLSDFAKELEDLLNRHSIDNYTETPDFLLAENIVRHIVAIKNMNDKKNQWGA